MTVTETSILLQQNYIDKCLLQGSSQHQALKLSNLCELPFFLLKYTLPRNFCISFRFCVCSIEVSVQKRN